MKVAILIDGTAYVSNKIKQISYVYPVYLSVSFSDGTVMVDKSETAERKAFYDKMLNSEDLPKTSQPSVGEVTDAYEKIIVDGYDTVFAITVSKILSGTYSTIYSVGQQYADQLDIHYINSKIVTIPEEIIAQYVIQMIENGYEADTIETAIREVIEGVKSWFSVDDLTNLIKGGRLSSTVGVIGSALKVKPVIAFDDEGDIGLKEIIRGQKKVYKKFNEYVKQHAEAQENGDFTLAIVGADNQEGIDKMLDILSNTITNNQIDVQTGEIGPVVATHAGKGALGIIIVPKPVIDGKVISAL